MASPSNLFNVDPAVCSRIRGALPWPRLLDGRLDPKVHRQYRQMLGQHGHFRTLAAFLNQSLAAAADAPGYAVVGLSSGLVGDLRLPTAMCSLVGRPFRLVGRLPLWQELGVDLDAERHRFGGVGYNPFHVDLVNASQPPPFTCLLSLRDDPLGGGQTILSNLARAVGRLASEHAKRLREPVFSEGRFFDLFGVGEELKRFPVIASENGGVRVRFTAKMDHRPGPYLDALHALNRELIDRQERFLLSPGQLLVINNLTMAHGREALGEPQTRVPADRRRFLRQTYLHALTHDPTRRENG